MSRRTFWITWLLGGLSAWLGLTYLVVGTAPTAFHRWLFFALLFLALSVTLTPVAHYLRLRFANPETKGGDLFPSFRRGGLAALFLVLCVWLQMIRALSWLSAGLLLGILILLEALVLSRGEGEPPRQGR